MSEMMRKFGVEEVPDNAVRCKVCGERYGAHSGSRCPRDIGSRVEPPTEMTSLKEIKGKLDALLRRTETIETVQDAIRFEQSEQFQKLIVRITDCRSYTHEQLTHLDAALKGTADGLADVIGEHDAWAKAQNKKADENHAINMAECAKKKKEWQEAAKSIAALLLRLHERLDKLEARPKKRRK